jgi:hypothetical protein
MKLLRKWCISMSPQAIQYGNHTKVPFVKRWCDAVAVWIEDRHYPNFGVVRRIDDEGEIHVEGYIHK